MLVLTRRIGQRIVIGGQITVTVNRIGGDRVSLALDAPHNIPIRRSELPRFENGTVGEEDTSPESSVSFDDNGVARQ